MPVEIKGDEITITRGDRRYRIRGLAKNLSHDLLKVNVLVSRGDALPRRHARSDTWPGSGRHSASGRRKSWR